MVGLLFRMLMWASPFNRLVTTSIVILARQFRSIGPSSSAVRNFSCVI